MNGPSHGEEKTYNQLSGVLFSVYILYHVGNEMKYN